MEESLSRRPDLADLYRLADQLQRDQEQPLASLQARDRGLAGQLPEGGGRRQLLLGWLDTLSPAAAGEGSLARGRFAVQLAGLMALVLGFSGMAGLLLGSERALVNVLLLLALFVVLQWLLIAGTLLVIWQLWRGKTPPVLPVHPGRWVLRRQWPDARSLREARPLLRLLFLRHGQALGALFTLGATLAFLVLPGLDDYSFVWGSTYALGESTMQSLVDALAAPWQALLPSATVAPDVLGASRYHAAITDLDPTRIERMRGWWGFLMLCLLSYALLPRLLLWLWSRWWYRRQVDRAFLGYPGVERLLARLRAPLVSTRSEGREQAARPGCDATDNPVSTPLPVTEPASLLLELTGALGAAGCSDFEELNDWQPAHSLRLGEGELQADRHQLEAIAVEDIKHLYLAVKGWEPPVAELADLLEPLADIPHCTVCLVPLPGRAIPHRKVEDWRQFSRALPFHAVDLQLLSPVVAP